MYHESWLESILKIPWILTGIHPLSTTSILSRMNLLIIIFPEWNPSYQICDELILYFSFNSHRFKRSGVIWINLTDISLRQSVSNGITGGIVRNDPSFGRDEGAVAWGPGLSCPSNIVLVSSCYPAQIFSAALMANTYIPVHNVTSSRLPDKL